MRASFLTVPILLLVFQLAAQQPNKTPSRVLSVLDGMKSAKWTQREEAFAQAIDLLSSHEITSPEADRIQLGIIQLLVHEDSGGLKEPENVAPENYGEGYGEDKAEYYSGLIEFVASMNDERAIPALLGAASSGGIAIRAVARFGKRALDPTLAQMKSQDPDLATGALFVVRTMLESRQVTDPESQQQIKNGLRSALGSPEYRVRENAMTPIEYLDDRQEFVPILTDIAEHDPYKSPYHLGGGSEEDQYTVRRAAKLLLRKMVNHELPPD